MKKLLLILFILPSVLYGYQRAKNLFAYNDSFNNTTITSQVLNIATYQHVGVHLIYTGTDIDGSCAMEASNDNTNWQEIAGSLVTLTAAGGTDYIDRSQLSAMFLRATCTSNDTNAVDMDIYISGK